MSKSSAFIHRQKLLQWKQIIADRRASGLTIVEYTRQHHISRDQYYYWLRRIRKELLEEHADVVKQATAPATDTAEVIPATETSISADSAVVSCQSQFFRVPVAAAADHQAGLMVRCGPFRFELTADTPPPLLRKLAAACGGVP